jgi:L-ascorbate metabolism protein UlaG (beta-lactamase superfamily)
VYSLVHVSPYDAVEIFQDMRCGRGLGMHRGTFELTSEPVEELPEKSEEAGLFDVCAVGESCEF